MDNEIVERMNAGNSSDNGLNAVVPSKKIVKARLVVRNFVTNTNPD